MREERGYGGRGGEIGGVSLCTTCTFKYNNILLNERDGEIG